jgi:hypothetical protein
MAHRVLPGAAVPVVLAARGAVHRAAPPGQAKLPERNGAAAGRPLVASVGRIALLRLRGGGVGRGGARGGVRALLEGVGCDLGDAAHALGGRVALDLDVAVHPPAGAPGVLDEPVGGAVLDAVADGQDAVIEGRAALAVEDTLWKGGVRSERGRCKRLWDAEVSVKTGGWMQQTPQLFWEAQFPRQCCNRTTAAWKHRTEQLLKTCA